MRAVLLCLLLAGCASEPKIINMPVATACLGDVPERPVYRFGKGRPGSSADQARALVSDFEAADQYGRKWEVAAAGCLLIKGGDPLNTAR